MLPKNSNSLAEIQENDQIEKIQVETKITINDLNSQQHPYYATQPIREIELVQQVSSDKQKRLIKVNAYDNILSKLNIAMTGISVTNSILGLIRASHDQGSKDKNFLSDLETRLKSSELAVYSLILAFTIASNVLERISKHNRIVSNADDHLLEGYIPEAKRNKITWYSRAVLGWDIGLNLFSFLMVAAYTVLISISLYDKSHGYSKDTSARAEIAAYSCSLGAIALLMFNEITTAISQDWINHSFLTQNALKQSINNSEKKDEDHTVNAIGSISEAAVPERQLVAVGFEYQSIPGDGHLCLVCSCWRSRSLMLCTQQARHR